MVIFRIDVKSYRESKGFTQQELAKLAKISQPYLNQIENNLKVPKIEILERISFALGICLNLLIIPDNFPKNCKLCIRKTRKS